MKVVKYTNNIVAIGVAATLTPFIKFDSSTRVHMLTNHLAQMIVPKISDIPRVMTCFETQLYSFDIQMPATGSVHSVHPKYRRGIDKDSIKNNPLITLIYRNQETGVYDLVNIETHHSKHRVFGFKYIINPMVSRIRPGMWIEKGTVLAHSPNVKDGGIYSSGISCNIINLSLPCCIEDGYGVSESFCEKASLTTLSNVVTQWGRKTYPLNIYGDPNHPEIYKPFPDIGDRVRPDGLVYALREFNPMFDPIEMTTKSLTTVDIVNDILVYGTPNALVYDVIVESGIGESSAKTQTPEPMMEQVNKYIKHLREYYSSIIESYEGLLKQDRNINISPRLSQLITRAYADTPNKNKSAVGGVIRRMYKNIPLDEFRVEIITEKQTPLGMGGKITGYHGDIPL